MNRVYLYGALLFVLGLVASTGPIFVSLMLSNPTNWWYAGDLLILGFFAFTSYFWDSFIIVVLMPVMFLLGGVIGGYLLSPVYLWVHSRVFRRSQFYGFLESYQPPGLRRWLSRGILPMLLTIYFSLTAAALIVEYPGLGILSAIAAPDEIAPPYNPFEVQNHIWSLTAFFSALVSMALVAPTWFFDDAGLITSNVEFSQILQPGRVELPDVSSMGSWYSSLLKGYAGIGVIVLYAQTIYATLLDSLYKIELYGAQEIFYFYQNVMLFPLLPVYILLLCLPLLMVLDRIYQRRQGYIFRLSKRLGITTHLKGKELV